MKTLFYMVLGLAMCCAFLWLEEDRVIERGCTASFKVADSAAFFAAFDSIPDEVPEKQPDQKAK